MAHVYIIFSQKLNRFYTGSCDKIEQRLSDHLNKVFTNSYTSKADDWELYFTINDLEYCTARKIENHIKSMRSKKYIQNLRSYPEITKKLISKFST
ncbi:MAG: GIY-YIG nuclease family protein [Bacteroidota bacterium]|nr:GIY-YIG nuclease family protein [Bacteroidota bacterium]